MDWNSVVNAGMGGQVFQDALIRTSEHLKTGAKEAINTYGSCLILGYIFKHASLFKFIPNDDIPAILALVGGISNLIVTGLSFQNFILGALMGLASTGMHQAFKNFVENNNEE